MKQRHPIEVFIYNSALYFSATEHTSYRTISRILKSVLPSYGALRPAAILCMTLSAILPYFPPPQTSFSCYM